MSYIAIDVGSGICKFANAEKREMFPSLVGKHVPDDSFKFGLQDFQTITTNGSTWLTGLAAQGYVEHGSMTLSTKQSWSDTDGHIILIYSAIAYLYPNGFSGEMAIVTGLPIRKFQTDSVKFINKLVGKHTFESAKEKYAVEFTRDKTIVIPQVVGLHFANMLRNKKENWEEVKVGYIDAGTQTIGWAVMEDGVFQNVLSNGDDVGLIKLAKEIKNYLKDKYNWEPSNNVEILKAMSKGYIEIFDQGKPNKIDIIEVAQQFVPKVYKQVIDKILLSWANARDMRVILSSGGGAYLIDTIKRDIPHATLIHNETKGKANQSQYKECIYDVMEGYGVYAVNTLTVEA